MFRKGIKKVTALLCAAAILLWIGVPAVRAAEGAAEEPAEDISGIGLIVDYMNIRNIEWLFDGKLQADYNYIDNAWITLRYPEGIGSLYMVFAVPYGEYTVTNEDTGETKLLGQNGFIHEFVDLRELFGAAPTTVTLRFENGRASLNEICAFTTGKVPDTVQKWELPKEGETDLVLFSTHGDDEQLFFAGLLPYYAGELGYQVQVVYLTDHRNISNKRMGEMLNGLWAVGVTTYPIFGTFPDALSQSMKRAYQIYHQLGIADEEVISFVVEQLRRFRPKVAVGHDVKGEYGHGMHMLYTDVLFKALEISNDPEQYPELAERYGVWDVPKTYIHLYPENKMEMDWDQPLSRFDGMTAYEVTRDLGYPCHVTQYYDFLWYFHEADTSAQVELYSPREYGLYRSLVGEDIQKNDFFENVTTYAQDAALEQQRLEEEAKRAEEERKAEEAQRAAGATETPRTPSTEPAQTAPAEPIQPEEDGKPVAVWWIPASLMAILLVFGALFLRKKRK